MEELYIIDASGYLYRSYFAIRNMTNDEGKSTNALFGFIRSLLKLFKEKSPQHIVSIFDGPHNSQSRLAIYPEYKAHRLAMPPDLLYQIQWAKDYCALEGISILSVPYVEADDTIGSVAKWAATNGVTSYICSSDKDLCQMVSDKIFILDTFKENLILGAKEVEEKFGVPPQLVVDYLALTGDSSDNVPGVPGIGPKTAAELLQEFGSLDHLLENPMSNPGKKKGELLEKNREQALLSRKLVTIDSSVDFPQDKDFFLKKAPEIRSLKDFYGSMKFHSLMKELPVEDALKEPESIQNYQLVDEEEALQKLIHKLETNTAICIDTETTSIHPMTARLVGVGLGVCENEAWYIPLNGKIGREKVLSALKPLLVNPKIGFFGHNIKYDAHVLENAGIPLKTIAFDTIIASYLLNTHRRKHSLDELSLEHFNFVKTPTEALLGKGKNQITMDFVPIEKVAMYCAEDVDYTIRLKNIFEKELLERDLRNVFDTLEMPLVNILLGMETEGIYVDISKLEEIALFINKEIERISKEIFALAGEEFNLNSPAQIGKILFEKMGIKPPKGTSTSAEVLEEIKWAYPIAGLIQEYRGVEKLRSTYVETLPGEVNGKTKRIHCTFNQSVTATGRLSCQDPNLQNIPIRSPLGLKIREAFRPQKEGWSYLSADYSQIELRLLAHFSEDPVLIKAFLEGDDIHSHTAAAVFHVSQETVTKEMRSKAKAVNFGIIYGQGAFGLSQALGISQKEAAQFIDMYFKQYPSVKAFLERCKDFARTKGKAVTLMGRERVIPEILSPNIQIRNAAERLAVNTPFQGSSADIIKKAMIDIDKALRDIPHQGFMILQIHDELLFEIPDEEIPLFKKIVKEKMENVISLKVPLTVDVEVGKNWKEC